MSRAQRGSSSLTRTIGEYTIDRRCVVAHGMGVGGQMSFYLGFAARDLVRGVATTGAMLNGDVEQHMPEQDMIVPHRRHPWRSNHNPDGPVAVRRLQDTQGRRQGRLQPTFGQGSPLSGPPGGLSGFPCDKKSLDAALRCALRGLQVDRPVRKVLTDNEIAANASGKRSGGVTWTMPSGPSRVWLVGEITAEEDEEEIYDGGERVSAMTLTKPRHQGRRGRPGKADQGDQHFAKFARTFVHDPEYRRQTARGE
jgi:hypothetical protein